MNAIARMKECGARLWLPVPLNAVRRREPRMPQALDFSSSSSTTMSRLRALALAVVASALPFMSSAAGQVRKCNINGSVSYQTTPCPSGEARRAPTVEELNAERQKKLRQSSDKEPTAATGRPADPPPASSRCDGRIHCSQMKSCAEAKYFLANCPGVKMDGDGDGIPCETQWCNM